MAGYRRSRVDEPDRRPGNLLHHRKQERIVGTAQDNDISPRPEQRQKAFRNYFLNLGSFKSAAFHKLHETAAHVFHHLDIVLDIALGSQIF